SRASERGVGACRRPTSRPSARRTSLRLLRKLAKGLGLSGQRALASQARSVRTPARSASRARSHCSLLVRTWGRAAPFTHPANEQSICRVSGGTAGSHTIKRLPGTRSTGLLRSDSPLPPLFLVGCPHFCPRPALTVEPSARVVT